MAILLFGCERRGPPPQAYRHLDDKLIAAFGLNDLFWPCTHREETQYGVSYSSTPVDDCYVMLPAQRMQGIWIDEFENSRFLPGRRTLPSSQHEQGPAIWLDWSIHVPHQFEQSEPGGKAILIDFIGRRTKYRGRYGHAGMFDHEIIVDRVISMKTLPPH